MENDVETVYQRSSCKQVYGEENYEEWAECECCKPSKCVEFMRKHEINSNRKKRKLA